MTPEEIKRAEEIIKGGKKYVPSVGGGELLVRNVDYNILVELARKALLLEKSGLVEAALFCLENSHRNGPAVLSKALTAYEVGK